MLAVLMLGCVGACKSPPAQQQAPATTPSAAPSVSVPTATAVKAAWYEGHWQGTYKAELYRIELAVGGVKAWKQDDGSQASGDGKLTLNAQPDGSVAGSASGPLGEHTVSGRIEGDRAALELIPKEAGGFRGVVLASQEAAGMKGHLSASTGDSLSVRQASVVLTRAAP